MLVDEAAHALKIDAIDLRLKNVFLTGMKNTQGAVPIGALRNDEILKRAKAHSLWAERATRKAQYSTDQPRQALWRWLCPCTKGLWHRRRSPPSRRWEVGPQGRVTLRHVATEIGPGVTTSQPIIAGRILGRVPNRTFYGVVEWPEMPLTASEQQFTMSQAMEDKLKKSRAGPRHSPRP